MIKPHFCDFSRECKILTVDPLSQCRASEFGPSVSSFPKTSHLRLRAFVFKSISELGGDGNWDVMATGR